MVPFHPLLNYTKFCMFVRGNSDDVRNFPGIVGGEEECISLRNARAQELLLDDDAPLRKFQPIECHMGLQDYLYKISLHDVCAIVSTGQRLTSQGISHVEAHLSKMLSGSSSSLRITAVERTALRRFAQELRPEHQEDLDALDQAVGQFLEIAKSMFESSRQALEDGISRELSLKAARAAASQAPWVECQRDILPWLSEALGLDRIAVFAGEEEIEEKDNAGTNVLAMRASWAKQIHPRDGKPHFNWMKSRIKHNGSSVLPDEAREICQRGIRGAGSEFWTRASSIHSCAVGLGLKGVLVTEGGGWDPGSQKDVDFLLTAFQSLMHSMLAAHHRARLRALRARVEDKTDFLQHQVRSRLAGIQTVERDLARFVHRTADADALLVGLQDLRSIHNDLAEVCHRAALPGFSLSDEKQLDWQLLQLEPVIASAIHNQEPYARSRNMDLQVDAGIGHLPDIEADSFRLRLVFIQLLNNAIKYSRQARPQQRRWIAISGELDRESIRLSVENLGRGIRSRNLERMFEKGVRLAEQDHTQSRFDRRKGYGYGLHECRQIITAHGGTIYAESTHVSGSEVRSGNIDTCITRLVIRLPLHRRH